MKLFVLLSLLCISPLMISGSIYYDEFQALKNVQNTKMLFEQDAEDGPHTNQCDLESYRPTLNASIEDMGYFENLSQARVYCSLGSIHRNIAMGKELSFFRHVLQLGLCDVDTDLVIVTADTMPSLYNYVKNLSQKAKIETPVVSVLLKEGFFKAFSRKILMFPGSIVIGQQLLYEVSNEELEAMVAQQIAHIKYNHYNKNYLLKGLLSLAAVYLINNNDITGDRLFAWFAIPVLSALILSKRFEKQVDQFVCKYAGNSAGIIAFYKRLQEKDQARAAAFDITSQMIGDNAADIPMITYIVLRTQYYLAKIEDCIVKIYNKFAYPSYQERIDAANAFLLHQGM